MRGGPPAPVRNDDAALGPLHDTTHESASCTSKGGKSTSCRSSEIQKASFGLAWLPFFPEMLLKKNQFGERVLFLFFEKLLLFDTFVFVFLEKLI